MWHILEEDAKAEARVAMTEAALDSCVKGAKESKAVVKARAAEMLLGEDGLQMYRLGIHFCLLPFSRDTAQNTHTRE